MKGMIVFSFAFRKEGHSSCNVRLAQAAKRIVEKIAAEEDEFVVVVAQRTTAAILKELGVPVAHVIKKMPGYEGSEEVLRQAEEIFRMNPEITEVIPVAQPFLQLTKCVQLVKNAGYVCWSFLRLVWEIGWIGFDWHSVQPWTRDLFRLVFYTFRQMFLGYKPPPELSE